MTGAKDVPRSKDSRIQARCAYDLFAPRSHFDISFHDRRRVRHADEHEMCGVRLFCCSDGLFERNEVDGSELLAFPWRGMRCSDQMHEGRAGRKLVPVRTGIEHVSNNDDTATREFCDRLLAGDRGNAVTVRAQSLDQGASDVPCSAPATMTCFIFSAIRFPDRLLNFREDLHREGTRFSGNQIGEHFPIG